jgi:hypothetical protein
MSQQPTPPVPDFDVRDLAPKGRPPTLEARVVDHARALEHYTALLDELTAELAAQSEDLS